MVMACSKLLTYRASGMVHILLLAGFHGSGKDTLGREIVKRHPSYRCIALSAYAKDIAAKRHGFNRAWADLYEEKDQPREEYGGKSIRDLVRSTWEALDREDPLMTANMLVAEINRGRPSDGYIITDFRYQRDYWKLLSAFGRPTIKTVRIQRDCVLPPDRHQMPEEYALEAFPFDVIIDNPESGTPEELYNSFIKVVELTRL